MDFKGTGKQALSKLWEYKYFIIGFVLVFAYVFSNLWYKDMILSFSNINYKNAPFNSTFVQTEGPNLSDVADSAYPSIFKTFYSGEEISDWDNTIALGTQTKDITNLINPMNIPFAFDFETAVLLKAVLEFLIGFLSMYLFLRSIGLRRLVASLGGVMYTFSSVMVVWLGWPHSDVIAIAPLLFFAIEKLIETVRIKYAILISLTVYSMLIVGMPTYAAYFIYLACIYIVFYTFKRYWKENKRFIWAVGILFAFSVCLAAVMSFPYTLSLVTGVGSNGYSESRAYQAELKLSYDYLRTLVYPYIRDNLRTHINESTVYVGLLPVVFAPFFFVNNEKKKRSLFFLFSSIVMTFLVFTDILMPIYKRIPMINTSAKIRVITLLTFSLAILGSIALNDIIENFEYYRKKLHIFVLALCWAAFVVYTASFEIYAANLSYVYFALIVIGVILLGTLLCILKFRKVGSVLIAAAVIFDCASFAREYLPYTSQEVGIVPEATDSVQYMMDNTEYERISGIGGWTMFPNTPSYYNLNDIRAHNFIMTNSDIRTYYETLSGTSYTTSTRVVMPEIDNYELLKYLGVKFIYNEDLGERNAYGTINDAKQPIGTIKTDSIITQQLELAESTAVGVEFLFATYGKVNTSDDEITVTLYDEASNAVASGSMPLSDTADNSYAMIAFDEFAQLDAGTYTLEIVFPDMNQSSLTMWKSNDVEGSFEFDGAEISGGLILNIVAASDDYDIVYRGKDNLDIAQLVEYSDKVELAESVSVLESDEAVLSAMCKDYIDNAAFVTSDSGISEYSAALSDGEGAWLVTYENDYIKINCSSADSRLLMVNDYCDSGWNAYVNGKKTDIVTVNYLMRGIWLEGGENIVVELKYEPKAMNFGLVCFVFSLVVLLVLCLFSRELQKLLDDRFLYAKTKSCEMPGDAVVEAKSDGAVDAEQAEAESSENAEVESSENENSTDD